MKVHSPLVYGWVGGRTGVYGDAYGRCPVQQPEACGRSSSGTTRALPPPGPSAMQTRRRFWCRFLPTAHINLVMVTLPDAQSPERRCRFGPFAPPGPAHCRRRGLPGAECGHDAEGH
eukprot:364553-Chlamydomonas_euryale.AAC.3